MTWNKNRERDRDRERQRQTDRQRRRERQRQRGRKREKERVRETETDRDTDRENNKSSLFVGKPCCETLGLQYAEAFWNTVSKVWCPVIMGGCLNVDFKEENTY